MNDQHTALDIFGHLRGAILAKINSWLTFGNWMNDKVIKVQQKDMPVDIGQAETVVIQSSSTNYDEYSCFSCD